jgi:hypothetical protein
MFTPISATGVLTLRHYSEKANGKELADQSSLADTHIAEADEYGGLGSRDGSPCAFLIENEALSGAVAS